MIWAVTIVTALIVMTTNIYAYETDFMPINSTVAIQRHGGGMNENMTFPYKRPNIGINEYSAEKAFTIKDNQYMTYITLLYDKEIKKDITEVYIYLNISTLSISNNGSAPQALAINTTAEISVNNKTWLTDAVFNSQGVLIYRVPASEGDIINNIRIRTTLTYQEEQILSNPKVSYYLHESTLIYSQTEADRIIEKLKEQSAEEKEQIESQQNKVEDKINALESSANAIEGIEKPTINIDKNPVDISKTSIPSLISNITNHPYLVMLFALVSTLVIISALLFGV